MSDSSCVCNASSTSELQPPQRTPFAIWYPTQWRDHSTPEQTEKSHPEKPQNAISSVSFRFATTAARKGAPKIRSALSLPRVCVRESGDFFNTLTGVTWNGSARREELPEEEANKMHITRLISYKLRLTAAQQNNLHCSCSSWPLSCQHSLLIVRG